MKTITLKLTINDDHLIEEITAAETDKVSLRLAELLIGEHFGDMVCSVCGCTENDPCEGGCWWSEPGLCTRCKEGIPDR